MIEQSDISLHSLAAAAELATPAAASAPSSTAATATASTAFSLLNGLLAPAALPSSSSAAAAAAAPRAVELLIRLLLLLGPQQRRGPLLELLLGLRFGELRRGRAELLDVATLCQHLAQAQAGYQHTYTAHSTGRGSRAGLQGHMGDASGSQPAPSTRA